MTLNLTYTFETKKAFLTEEFEWIPKSVVTSFEDGVIYEVADWFVYKNPGMIELVNIQKELEKA